MRTFVYISILIAITLTTACPNKEVEKSLFDFYNNSTGEVYFYLSVADKFLYPDTLLIDTDIILTSIKGNDKFKCTFYKEKGIDTLSFFILSSDTLSKYSWEEIKRDYNILARYDLDVTDIELRKLNFDISYPPTKSMKNIKMYPPYSTYIK